MYFVLQAYLCHMPFENINEILRNIYVVSGTGQPLKCKNRDLKKYKDVCDVQF